MDVLRALSTPNMDVRNKVLDIALDLITARNIDEARPAMMRHSNVLVLSSTCETPAIDI